MWRSLWGERPFGRGQLAALAKQLVGALEDLRQNALPQVAAVAPAPGPGREGEGVGAAGRGPCRFDAELPDIDLLVVSPEPTLGVAVLTCEVKAPLPPRWAKDQLRVLRPDSVAKSFGQLKRIFDFLKTEQGAGFLRGLLPEDGLAGFDEFAAVCYQLAVVPNHVVHPGLLEGWGC